MCHQSAFYFCSLCISNGLIEILHLILSQFDITKQQDNKEAQDTINKKLIFRSTILIMKFIIEF
ncbi:unnamed protein product [Paramecium sonneborni]|uniref:Uncharacterized protein n=1 Tax=Paramecium sonneborni TaxID=65129 RepID=A0A8S1PW31_9CILI|nr:unnamed protein product [Paramecium sonneborni]